MRKKLFALAIATIFVLGTVATAFGAPLPDIAGTDYEEAAGKLDSVGIMSGFPDGEFKGEETLTRAQLATIAIRAMGLEIAASMAEGATQFTDVPASHWASGYINIATQRGIIQGYPDGTFGPDQEVTNQEALTIFIRMIGLGPVVDKEGTWPSNYVSRAAQEGILDNVSVAGSGAAKRGNVAIMLEETITINVWEADQYGDDGSVRYGQATNKTLLSDRLNVVEYSKSNSGIDEVRVVGYDIDDNELEIDITGAANITAENKTSVDLYEAYLNEVTIWVDDDGDGDIVYLGIDSDYYIDAIETDSTVAAGEDITLIGEDKELEITTGYTDIVNGDDTANLATDTEYEYAKVVLNSDGDVEYIDAYNWTEAYWVIDVDDALVTDHDGDEVDLDDYTIFKDGKLITWEEIEEGDILFFNQDDFAEVYNKSYVGKITDVFSATFELEGKSFGYNAEDYDRLAQYFDEDGDLDDFTVSEAEDMEDEGEDVEVFVDRKDEAVFVIGEVGEPSSDEFAIYLTEDISTYMIGSRAYMEIEGVNEFGEEVYYEFRLSQIEEIASNGAAYWDDDEIGLELSGSAVDAPVSGGGTVVLTPGNPGISKDDIIEVTVDEDGDIIGINYFNLAQDIGVIGALNDELELDDTYAVVTRGAVDVNRKLAAGNVVFDISDGKDSDDIVVTKWGDLEGVKVAAGNAWFILDGSDVEYIVLEDYDSEDTSEYEGIITQIRTNSDDELTRIKILIDGSVETVYTDTDKVTTAAGIALGMPFEIETDDISDEIITMAALTENPSNQNVTAGAVSISDREVAVVGGATYELVAGGYIIDATDTGDIKVITFRELRDMAADGDIMANNFHIVLDAAGTEYAKFFIVR